MGLLHGRAWAGDTGRLGKGLTELHLPPQVVGSFPSACVLPHEVTGCTLGSLLLCKNDRLRFASSELARATCVWRKQKKGLKITLKDVLRWIWMKVPLLDMHVFERCDTYSRHFNGNVKSLITDVVCRMWIATHSHAPKFLRHLYWTYYMSWVVVLQSLLNNFLHKITNSFEKSPFFTHQPSHHRNLRSWGKIKLIVYTPRRWLWKCPITHASVRPRQHGLESRCDGWISRLSWEGGWRAGRGCKQVQGQVNGTLRISCVLGNALFESTFCDLFITCWQLWMVWRGL